MAPMMIVEFRFRGRFPEKEALVQALQGQLGASVQRLFDSIEAVDDRFRALGQDPIALVYFAQRCQAIGGKAVDPGGDREGVILIPSWARVPWTQHGLLRRLRIRLGRISLARIPDEEAPPA